MKGKDLYSVNGGYEADSVRNILYQYDLDLDKLEGRQGEKFRFWSISTDEKGNPTFDPLFGNLELDKSFKRERAFGEGDLLFSYKPSDGEQLIEGTVKHKPAIIFTGEENGCPTKPIVAYFDANTRSYKAVAPTGEKGFWGKVFEKIANFFRSKETLQEKELAARQIDRFTDSAEAFVRIVNSFDNILNEKDGKVIANTQRDLDKVKKIVSHLSETKNSGDLENSPERVTSAIVLDMIKRNPKPFIQNPDMAVKMVNGLLNDKTVKTLSEMSTADFLKSFRSTSSREKILKQVEATMKEQKKAPEKTHEEAKKEKALAAEPKKENQGLVRR